MANVQGSEVPSIALDSQMSLSYRISEQRKLSRVPKFWLGHNSSPGVNRELYTYPYFQEWLDYIEFLVGSRWNRHLVVEETGLAESEGKNLQAGHMS